MAAKKRSPKQAAKLRAEESQQEPEQDSGLQTPQPDQPMPTEVERQEQESRKDDSDSEPRPLESETADDAPEQPRVDEGDQPDQQPEQPRQIANHVVEGGKSFRADVVVPDDKQRDVAVQREVELARARNEHNQRTGAGHVHDHEVLDALELHNRRSAHRLDALTEA